MRPNFTRSSAGPELRPDGVGLTGPEVRRRFARSSSARPEVHPLVVDVYAVSDTQQRRRHDDSPVGSHVGYSWWSRDRPAMTSYDDDDYDADYDDPDYSDAGAGHVTSYLGRSVPGSRGHEAESSLGQSGGRREVDDDQAASPAADLPGPVVAMVLAVATVTMATVRRLC